MKKLVVIISVAALLFSAGCNTIKVTNENIGGAIMICTEHGGVSYMSNDCVTGVMTMCKDGSHFSESEVSDYVYSKYKALEEKQK